ncbi:MAG: sugar phosphate isomerase/epimerase family protein [Thermoprotei archaeon]
MRLGFVADRQIGDLQKTFEWAKRNGFEGLELMAAPGSIADPEKVQGAQLRSLGKKYGQQLELDFWQNPLDPDLEKRKVVINRLRKVVELAASSDIGIIVGSCGKFSAKLEDNYAQYSEVYPEIADFASSHGVKIAFEIYPGFNFAHAPSTWKKLFDLVPSRSLGINLDPSHLIWQFVDYLEAVRDYSDRVYSVHAKDAEIIRGRLSSEGILGSTWWRYRVPGWGEVNWPSLISALIEVKYAGMLFVENEDPLFGFEEGILKGHRYLKALLA